MAGPVAGAVAVLLLLKCQPFISATQQMLSQTSTFFCLVILAWLVFPGWGSRKASWIMRFLIGLVAGATIFIRNSNIILAPAVALFSFLVIPGKNRSRFAATLPVCSGIAVAAVLVLTFNAAQYGSPFKTGDMGWVNMGGRFSLDYFWNPPLSPIGDMSFPILEPLLGFGPLYSWMVALSAAAGLFIAWHLRSKCAAFYQIYLLMILSTLLNGVFLAFYFMRSDLYLMLTVPFVVMAAAATLDHVCRFLNKKIPSKGSPVMWVPLMLALVYLFAYQGAPEFKAWRKEPAYTPNVTSFENADRITEDNAVLISSANPILADYLFIKKTSRRYLLLTEMESPILRGVFYRELGSNQGGPAAVGNYVQRKLAEGVPVYLMNYLFYPYDQKLIESTLKFLRKNYRLQPTDVGNIFRVKERGTRSSDHSR
jgi:hypothetical protein